MGLRPWIGSEPVQVQPYEPSKKPEWFGAVYTPAYTGRIGPTPGSVWNVHSVNVYYGTDANVADRTIVLALNGGGFTTPEPAIYRIPTTLPAIVNSTARYSFAKGAGDSAYRIGNVPFEIHPLPDIELYDNMGFQLIGYNGQVGDSWIMNVYGYRYQGDRRQ